MKKQFRDYLTQAEKIYDFRIKIANIELDADMMTKFEDTLKTYDLRNLVKSKRLPIQNRMVDFSTIGPCEVSVYDVTLGYPVTDEQLKALIVDKVCVPSSHVLVVPRFHPEEMRRDDEMLVADKEKTSVLDKDYDKETKVTPVFGDEYNKQYIKKLTTRKYEFAKKESADGKTTNDLPLQNKSPVGSNKIKFKKVSK